MAKYAMIDTITNYVGNIIEWDGESLYLPPENCILIPTDTAGLGDTYDPTTGQFIKPVIIEQPPKVLTAEEKLANAGLTVEELKTLLGL
jgi:hypothetical protein